MRLLILSLLSIAGLIPNASGEEERARWNIIAECQMVTLPQKTALALLPELSDDARIEAGFARIQKLIESGEAKLVANLVGRALDGENGAAESIEEVRYPVEFDPPSLPQNAPAETPEELKNSRFLGITPTAFETRNVGAMLEVNSSAGRNGQILSAHVVVQHVRLAGWRKFVAGVIRNGEQLSIEQPQFQVLKNTSALRLRNAQRVLLAVHKTAEPPDTLEFFFLRLSATATP